ncbi:MAG: metalloprotease TldD [Pseudomonadota bacterium]|nr:metalloprotease TldD [Pseudomonadota bacterium]
MKRIKKNWDDKSVCLKVDKLLNKYDDGELFVEEVFSENIYFDDNKIKNASHDQDKGFGLRAVDHDSVNFFHNTELDEVAFNSALQSIENKDCKPKKSSEDKTSKSNASLYTAKNPINLVSLANKIDFLKKVNQYARNLDPKVKEVSVSLNGNYQNLEIVRKNGCFFYDSRPLVRMNINITVKKRDKIENGSFGMGGRYTYENFFVEENWKEGVNKAYKQAIVRLSAKETPAGEQTVILGPGWPGILLHEAIGHGLEGDFNRKETSAFYNLLGQKIASDQITVVDDGTISDRRGSLTIDDEGTPSQNTTLIEKGILKGFMHDRLNARLMKQSPTGNGRRQSYSHIPMPRMTNTYMLEGKYDHEELIKSTKKGIFATQFSGGQVDITSGKFVFSASEAYEIINGKIGRPLKGATLIGNGPEILKEVTMVANNLQLDEGIGTCGKEGQSVPVGVGQPSLKVRNLTVGGTI